MYDLNFGPKLYAFKHLNRKFQLGESNAFSKSVESILPLILFLSASIKTSSMILMLLPINLPFM